MKGVMMPLAALVLCLSLVESSVWGALRTADRGRDGERAPPPRSLQFQELEDPVEPLEPKVRRTDSDNARIDALAWFAAGRILQDRQDFSGALSAYQKAVERDPTAIPVYRVLIPLAIELRRADVAVRWAVKAVERNPADQQFVLQAVALLADSLGDQQGAIRILEQAANAPGIDKQSPYFVIIMRYWAVSNLEADRTIEAAKGFEVLFDALVNPEKYKLDAGMRDRLQKDKATGFEKMGQVFLEAKKTDLALAAFRKAAESKKGPAPGNLSFNLAQVHSQAGQFEQALAELQKYIDAQRSTKGRAAYELLGEILEKMGKSKELIPRLEAAAQKDTRNSSLTFFLAEKYAQADRLDEAEALYLKTLESETDAQGFAGLAEVYRRKNRPVQLLEALRQGYSESGELKAFTAEFKAIIADDKFLESVLKTGEERLAEEPPTLDFAAGYVLANLSADAKKSDQAEKFYRYLLPLRKERAGLIFEELGAFFLEIKDYPRAAKVYTEASEEPGLEDKRAEFLHQLTFALEMSGETAKALEAIAAAQQIIPDNPLLLYREAWVYYHSRRFDEAIERMEGLIAQFPPARFPHPQIRQIVRGAQYSLSNIYVTQGDVRRGEEILEVIYEETPDEKEVNNDLGYLYADQGKNLEQAEGMIRKALAAEPENGAYLDSLGWVLFKRDKAEEALPYLEKAVKNSPGAGDETLWEHLADVHEKLQQPAKALEAWKKSLEFSDKAPFPDKKLIERVKEKIARHQKEPESPKSP